MSEKVTAGRDYLGGFAPGFEAFNDDILFGKVWAKEDNLSAILYVEKVSIVHNLSAS